MSFWTVEFIFDPGPSFLLVEHLDLHFQPVTTIVNKRLIQFKYSDSYKNAIFHTFTEKTNILPGNLKNYKSVSNLNFSDFGGSLVVLGIDHCSDSMTVSVGSNPGLETH